MEDEEALGKTSSEYNKVTHRVKTSYKSGFSGSSWNGPEDDDEEKDED